jgi:hypothetical protein
LHPVQKDFEQWQLISEQFPNAAYAGKHIINLPTGDKDRYFILDFLNKIEKSII